MGTLRSTLAALASQFADSVLEALRAASLEEIVAEGGGGRRGKATLGRLSTKGKRGSSGARLRRRSMADIDKVVDEIVALVGKHPDGLRAEDIRKELGLQAKELPRPLADAVNAKRLTKSGQKRATTYFSRDAKKRARAK